MKDIRNLFIFKPPLRLIVTSKCNGHCNFCHKEGFKGYGEMSMEDIICCSQVANELKIPKICLSGGEPSTRNDLSQIINNIQSLYCGKLVLTSNGKNLLECAKSIKSNIHKLNLSIVSFKNEITQKYQNVSFDIIKQIINSFPSDNVNLNLVVVHDNYLDLPMMIEFCITNNISMDIMFNISNNSDEHKYLSIIENNIMKNSPYIEMNGVPKLVIYKSEKCIISIKHPWFSSLITRKICNDCPEKCKEHVCAVRVYPDKSVSPCLSSQYEFKNGGLKDNIISAYNAISD